jgi:hypothetical protein
VVGSSKARTTEFAMITKRAMASNYQQFITVKAEKVIISLMVHINFLNPKRGYLSL